jgi:hypothetical protein
VPAVDQVRQRQLDPADPLKHALAVLQLARLPRSVGSLHRKTLERFPAPERSWSWDLASAYAAVFDAICQASGSSARARSGRGQA